MLEIMFKRQAGFLRWGALALVLIFIFGWYFCLYKDSAVIVVPRTDSRNKNSVAGSFLSCGFFSRIDVIDIAKTMQNRFAIFNGLHFVRRQIPSRSISKYQSPSAFHLAELKLNLRNSLLERFKQRNAPFWNGVYHNPKFNKATIRISAIDNSNVESYRLARLNWFTEQDMLNTYSWAMGGEKCLSGKISAFLGSFGSRSGGSDVLLEMRKLLLRFYQQSASVFDKVSSNTEKQRSEYNKQFVMVIAEPIPQPSNPVSEAEKNRAAKKGTLALIGLLIGGIVAYFIIYAPF
jgi:hypothetical protein